MKFTFVDKLVEIVVSHLHRMPHLCQDQTEQEVLDIYISNTLKLIIMDHYGHKMAVLYSHSG